MCDKMAISAYISKVVEKTNFQGLELRKCLIVTYFFSTNKQYVMIKLMQNAGQNETNRWNIFLVKTNIGFLYTLI